MSEQVVLGTEGGTCVILRGVRSADSEGWLCFVVELHGAGLDVVRGVLTHEMSPLPAFVHQLECDWRGWNGTRNWESTEPALAIAARHSGRHVFVRWTAVDGPDLAWQASLELLVEPGEQLKSFADDVAQLFATS